MSYPRPSSSPAWGVITGTLSAQTDLQNALNAKAPIASPTFTGTVTVPTGAVLGTPASLSLANATGLPPAGVTGTAAILGANTFTAAQTIAAGTLITQVLSLSQTWNNGATAGKGIVQEVTNTSTPAYSSTWSAVSTLIDLKADAATKFAVIPKGSENLAMLRLGGTDGTHALIKDSNSGGIIIRRSDGIDNVALGAIGGNCIGICVADSWAGIFPGVIGFNSTSNVMAGGNSTPDALFRRKALSSIQMGLSSASTLPQSFSGPSGVGDNKAGGKLSIAPGQSTGNATPAVLALQGTAAGSSGTTAQTLVDVLSIKNSTTIELAVGVNIHTSSSVTGTMIATGSSQKLGFWGATAVAQQAGNILTGLATSGAGATVNDETTFDGGSGSQYTINGLIAALKTIGILG